MGFAAAFLVILLAAPAVFAADYNINWALGTSYSNWATRSLNAGDRLVFTYDSTHTVDVVSKSDYDNCVSSNAIETHTNSPTTITLKEGPTYIICGTAGHCQGGMKLQVNAKASGGSSPAPSSTPSSPTPGPSPSNPSSPAPSSRPTTPSSPGPSGSSSPISPSGSTPSDSGAFGLSSGHLMLGVPLVLGTLFAFMG